MLEQRPDRRFHRARVGGFRHVALFLFVLGTFVVAQNEAPRVVGEMLAPEPLEYPRLSYLAVVDSGLNFSEERALDDKRSIVGHMLYGLEGVAGLSNAAVHEAWGYLAAYTRAVQHAQRRAEVMLIVVGLAVLAYLSSRTGYGWFDPLMLWIPIYGWLVYFPKILWRATSPEPYWSEG